MRKFWSIFTHEIITLVWRPSYWLGVVGVPLLSLLLYGAINLLNPAPPQTSSTTAPAAFPALPAFQSLQSMQSFSALKEMVSPTEDTRLPLGVVDLAGVTSQVPQEVDPGDYALFGSQASAQQALARGNVRAFYLFPEEFIETGEVFYYANSLSLSRALALDPGLDYWVRYNLAGGHTLALDAAYHDFIVVDETNLDPANAPRFNILEGQSMTSMMMVFYFLTVLLLFSSGMIFSSFNNESSNRVMEVLLVSTSAEQVLWGKFAALSLVGLAQIVLWVAGMAAFGAQMSATFAVQALQAISPQLIGWVVLFAALSFLLYGALMLGLATVFPYLREGPQLMYAIMTPLFLPLMLLLSMPQTPNHWLLVIFSLFPLTAPTTILMRMMIINVPLWQPIVSAVLLLASTLGVVRFLALNFRPAHLLSTKSKYQWFSKSK